VNNFVRKLVQVGDDGRPRWVSGFEADQRAGFSSGAGGPALLTGSRLAPSAPDEIRFEADWAAAAALLGLDPEPGPLTASLRTTAPAPMVSISKAEVAALKERAVWADGSDEQWEHWRGALLC
jgi:hypothetical protein